MYLEEPDAILNPQHISRILFNLKSYWGWGLRRLGVILNAHTHTESYT